MYVGKTDDTEARLARWRTLRGNLIVWGKWWKMRCSMVQLVTPVALTHNGLQSDAPETSTFLPRHSIGGQDRIGRLKLLIFP